MQREALHKVAGYLLWDAFLNDIPYAMRSVSAHLREPYKVAPWRGAYPTDMRRQEDEA